MAFRVQIDLDKCIGAGECVALAPDVFDLDDSGTVVVLEEEPRHGQEASVRAAAAACPAWVIEVVDVVD